MPSFYMQENLNLEFERSDNVIFVDVSQIIYETILSRVVRIIVTVNKEKSHVNATLIFEKKVVKDKAWCIKLVLLTMQQFDPSLEFTYVVEAVFPAEGGFMVTDNWRLLT